MHKTNLTQMHQRQECLTLFKFTYATPKGAAVFLSLHNYKVISMSDLGAFQLYCVLTKELYNFSPVLIEKKMKIATKRNVDKNNFLYNLKLLDQCYIFTQ